MSSYTASSGRSGRFKRWWKQSDLTPASRNRSTESLDCSREPAVGPRPRPSHQPSVSRFPRLRAGLDSVVSGALSPFGSKRSTARVYSRPSTSGPPDLSSRPVLNVPAPAPTGLQRMARRAGRTAASVVSGIANTAASLSMPCFRSSATESRYEPSIYDGSSAFSFDLSDSPNPPEYKDHRRDLKLYPLVPSGVSPRPGENRRMSELRSGLSRWTSNSPYSGAASAPSMTSLSHAPPSYAEATSQTSGPSGGGDARDADAALWRNFQHTRQKQDRGENVNMWGQWIRDGFRSSTIANAQSASRHTGRLPFGAISIPRWSSGHADVSSAA